MTTPPATARPSARVSPIWSAGLLTLALGMLAYRFAHVDLAPFARDEPQFLAAAGEQLRTGRWLAANPLYGNLGLRYGPAAFWFYGLVEALLGRDPRVAIAAMGLVVTAAQLALALALRRLFAESAAFLAVLVAWIASSPYEFLWSRLAWDLTSNAAVFAAAALVCGYRVIAARQAAVLGVVMGLGVATHPMVAPMALAVAAAVAFEARGRGRRGLGACAALGLSMLAVNLPYLVFLVRAPIVGRAARVPFSVAGMLGLVLQAPRLTTTWGLPYYFGEAWPDFRAWLGSAADLIDPLSAGVLAGCLAATIAGVAAGLRSTDLRFKRASLAAAVAWTGNLALLAVVALERHPHYNFSSAWVPVFGVAAALAWLRRRRPRAGAAALALLALVAVAQFSVVVSWMGFVRASGGTRSPGYGTPVGLQMAAMRTVCAAPGSQVVLRNETAMYPFPFQYLAGTEPACRGKTVFVCGAAPAPLPRPCPAPAAGSRALRLRYANATGGALAVEDESALGP